MADDHSKSPHIDPNIAYHIGWEFGKGALIVEGKYIQRINFHPLATELRDWLKGNGSFVIFTESDKSKVKAISNPHTYDASVIVSILANVINSAHAFSTSTEEILPVDAEVERIRLYSELTLYTARVCEALIKQLLYCTNIPQKYYKKSSLGGLLSADCKECRKAGKPKHRISMLGSIAHRYDLCLPIEKCLSEHLKIVNRRRNVEAAHSESLAITNNNTEQARAQLFRDAQSSGNDLVHMLEHISELEGKMREELKLWPESA